MREEHPLPARAKLSSDRIGAGLPLPCGSRRKNEEFGWKREYQAGTATSGLADVRWREGAPGDRQGPHAPLSLGSPGRKVKQ
jgi:hypothetical protein